MLTVKVYTMHLLPFNSKFSDANAYDMPPDEKETIPHK